MKRPVFEIPGVVEDPITNELFKDGVLVPIVAHSSDGKESLTVWRSGDETIRKTHYQDDFRTVTLWEAA